MKKYIVHIIAFLSLSVTAKPPALPNLSNSCYMNGMLQGLLSMSELISYITQKTTKPSTQFGQFLQKVVQDPYDHEALQNLYGEVQIQIAYTDFVNWLKNELFPATIDGYHYNKVMKLVQNKIENLKQVSDPIIRRQNKLAISFLQTLQKSLQRIQKIMQAYGDLKKLKKLLDPNLYKEIIVASSGKIQDVRKELLKRELARAVGATKNDVEYKFRNFIATTSEECEEQDASELLQRIIQNFVADADLKNIFEKLVMFIQQPKIFCFDDVRWLSEEKNTIAYVSIEHTESKNILPDLYAILSYNIFSPLAINQNCFKHEPFVQIGDYLIILLKRVRAEWDDKKKEMVMKKITTPVHIPLQLDMRNFVLSDKIPELDSAYALVSSINHLGRIGSGHYIAYVKDHEGWWKCDDDKISKLTELEAQQAVSEGYVLIYQRMKSKDAKILFAERDLYRLGKALRSIS
jgi:hypothetical protein